MPSQKIKFWVAALLLAKLFNLNPQSHYFSGHCKAISILHGITLKLICVSDYLELVLYSISRSQIA